MDKLLRSQTRPTQIAIALLRAALMAVAFALNSWLVIDISQHHGGMAAIWSANALLLFAVLGRPARQALPFYAGAFAASLLANGVGGYGWRIMASFSLANMVEVAFAAAAIRRLYIPGESKFAPKNIVRFVVATILACSLSATLAITGLDKGIGDAWRSWFMSDMLGILLLLPILLVARDLVRGRRKISWSVRDTAEQLLVYVLVFAVTLAIFAQSVLQITFIIAIPILVAVFKAGRTGAALSTLLVAVTAVAATLSGHGPFAGAATDATHAMLLLQAFLACQLLIALPVASVLEQRSREAMAAFERERVLRASADSARRKAENANRRLALSVARDDLTGLRSRKRIVESLKDALERPAGKRAALTIAIFDIDHFKRINDRFGHGVGDDALRTVGRICREVLPRRFGIGRIGGEEFLLLMPGQTLEMAANHAERLRLAIMSQSGQGPCGVTISLGLAEAQDGDSSTSLMHAADLALYQAKSAGRNRLMRAA